MASSSVSVPTPAGTLSAYRSAPAGEGPWPGVVVIHEVFGLNDDIRAHADRLASHGYLALAPDLYSAAGRARCLVETFRSLLRRSGPAYDRLEAVVGWLAGQPGCSGRLGVVGFCLGGGFALMAGVRFRLQVAAVNYGEVPKDAEAVLAGVCPVVASYGLADRTMRGRPERLEGALTALGVAHDVKAYAGAGHGFLSQHRVPALVHKLERVAGLGYDEPAAQDAWARILAFFAEHLQQETGWSGLG